MKESKQKINIYKVSEFSEKFFVCDIQQSIWHTLSEYQNEAFSRKFIEQNYKFNKFGKRNYKEIASFFSFNIRQGIEYFQNSLTASLAIRPLLLFYGILSFSKAIIVLNNPDYLNEINVSKKKKKHGLSYDGTDSKKFSICDDLITVQKDGTFNFFQKTLDYPLIADGTKYSLRKLYSWMPEFSLVETDVYIPDKKFNQYIEEIPVRANGKLVKEYVKNEKGKLIGKISIELVIPKWKLNVKNPQKNIKKIIPELIDYSINSNDNENLILSSQTVEFDLKDISGEFTATKQVLWKLNKISHFDGRNVYLFQRLKGESYLAYPLICYLIAYILSSICRYEPKKWIRTLEAKETDEKWLAELAINEITNSFPLFVISHLRRGVYVKFALR